MTKLCITLVHNKTDKENFDQIEALKQLIVVEPYTVDGHDEETGEVIPDAYTLYRYKIKGMLMDHEVVVRQIIPYGVTPPSNRYEVNNGGIIEFGAGEEDKVGDHPRFFNLALKRGTDIGADVVLYLEDVAELDVNSLSTKLSALMSTKNKTEFTEDTYGKMATRKLYTNVARLDETKQLSEAITEFKAAIVEKGMLNG